MLQAVKGAAFVSLLLTSAVTDIKSRTIPYSVCVLITLTGLISFSPVRLWGALLALPFFFASGLGRGGAGDFYLIAASSLVLGLTAGAAGLFFALLCFCLFYLAAATVRKRSGKRDEPVSYPLAPFLAAGFIAAYFMGGVFL